MLLGIAAVTLVLVGENALSQPVTPTNSAPNPYRSIENWGQLPQGRAWGSTSAVGIDPDGTSVWVAERCGETRPPSRIDPKASAFACGESTLDPILKFDSSGKLIKSFGAGLLLFPHGLHVDRAGNVWVTDGLGRGGKGHQVFKFSPDGKVLLMLGKPNQPGSAPDHFNAPSAVVIAPNGDIFVADGHGGRDANARIVKFDKDGKFIKPGARRAQALANSTSRTPSPWTRKGGCSWRPAEQPNPDLRPGRQLYRPVASVQPAERRVHRQERHHLRGRFRSPSRSPRTTTAGSAASASAGSATAR